MWSTQIRRFASDSLIFSDQAARPQIFDAFCRNLITRFSHLSRHGTLGIEALRQLDKSEVLKCSCRASYHPIAGPGMTSSLKWPSPYGLGIDGTSVTQLLSPSWSSVSDLDQVFPGIWNFEISSSQVSAFDEDLYPELQEMDCPTAVPHAPVLAIKRTFQPSTVRKKRQHGFLVRNRSGAGKKIIQRRRAKGRSRLSL